MLSHGRESASGPEAGFAGRRRGGAVERVGGRRPFRAGAVALVASLIFIGGALLKPWAGGPFSGGPARTPAERSSPAATPAAVPATTAAVPASGGYARIDWHSVDWTALTAPDPHTGWGVSSATLTLQGDAPDGSRRAKASSSWASSSLDDGSDAQVATVPDYPGRRVFALAITWPADVAVDSVAFTYNSPEATLSDMGALDGFTPMAELFAVPAAQATAADPTAADPAARAAAPSSGTIISGQFWVAPVEKVLLPYISSPAQMWRYEPWWWPTGEYKVTVSYRTGIQTLVVRLAPHA